MQQAELSRFYFPAMDCFNSDKMLSVTKAIIVMPASFSLQHFHSPVYPEVPYELLVQAGLVNRILTMPSTFCELV